MDSAKLALASVLLSIACSTSPLEPGDETSSSAGSSSDDELGSSSDDDGAEPRLDIYVPPDVGIVCIEPEGERVAVVDCDPCAASRGFGASVYDPVSWVVTRLVPPSYPYRVDTLMAEVSAEGAFEMFWLVDDFIAPPIEPVFEDRIELEVEFGELATWAIEPAIVLEEGEFLFVGLTLPAEDTVYSCDEETEEEQRVFTSPAVSPAEWINLLGVAPVVFAYGAPA